MGFKIVLTILILTSSDVRKEWQLFKSIKDDFTIERYRLFVKTKNMFLHRFHTEEDKFFRLRKIIKKKTNLKELLMSEKGLKK